MRFAILVAIVLCLLLKEVQATSLIAVRAPTNILLGVDSKLISRDRSITRTLRKIGISKDVPWGEPGILEMIGALARIELREKLCRR